MDLNPENMDEKVITIKKKNRKPRNKISSSIFGPKLKSNNKNTDTVVEKKCVIDDKWKKFVVGTTMKPQKLNKSLCEERESVSEVKESKKTVLNNGSSKSKKSRPEGKKITQDRSENTFCRHKRKSTEVSEAKKQKRRTSGTNKTVLETEKSQENYLPKSEPDKSVLDHKMLLIRINEATNGEKVVKKRGRPPKLKKCQSKEVETVDPANETLKIDNRSDKINNSDDNLQKCNRKSTELNEESRKRKISGTNKSVLPQCQIILKQNDEEIVTNQEIQPKLELEEPVLNQLNINNECTENKIVGRSRRSSRKSSSRSSTENAAFLSPKPGKSFNNTTEKIRKKYSALHNFNYEKYPILKLENQDVNTSEEIDVNKIKTECVSPCSSSSSFTLRVVQVVLEDVRYGKGNRKIIKLNRDWNLTQVKNRSRHFRYKVNNNLTPVTSRNDIFCEAQLTEGFTMKSNSQSPLILEQITPDKTFIDSIETSPPKPKKAKLVSNKVNKNLSPEKIVKPKAAAKNKILPEKNNQNEEQNEKIDEDQHKKLFFKSIQLQENVYKRKKNIPENAPKVVIDASEVSPTKEETTENISIEKSGKHSSADFFSQETSKSKSLSPKIQKNIEITSENNSTNLPKPRHTFKFEKSAIKRPPTRMPKKVILNRPQLSPEIFKVPLSPSKPIKTDASPKTNYTTGSILSRLGPYVKPERDIDSISIYAETIGNESVVDRAVFSRYNSDDDNSNDDNSNDDIIDDIIDDINDDINDGINEENNDVKIEVLPVPMDPVKQIVVNEWVDNTVKICESQKQAIESNVLKKVCPEDKSAKGNLEDVIPLEAENNELSSSKPCGKAINMFQNSCFKFLNIGKCNRKVTCWYRHDFPPNWKEELMKLPIESVLELYDFVKMKQYIFFYKEIFPVITEYLGEKRDFNNLIKMVKDVIEIDIYTDRAPYISQIIDALCKPGLTFHSIVEVVYKSANVSPCFINLLSDILLTLIVEKGDCGTNWIVIKELFQNKKHDVDSGIIRAVIVECLQKKFPTKELFYKVYHDLVEKVADYQLSQINTSILNNFYMRLKRVDLITEANEYYTRCQNMNINLGNRSDRSSSPASPAVNNSVTSSPTVKVSPIKNTETSLNNYVPIKPLLSLNPIETYEPMPCGSITASPPAYVPSPILPNYCVTRPGHKFNADNYNIKRNRQLNVKPATPYLSSDVSFRPNTFQQIFNEIKRALISKNYLKIFDLILKYKDNHLTDIFMKSLIDLMIDKFEEFTTFYENLWETTKFANQLEDKNLKYVLKALGLNIIIHLCRSSNWADASTIYKSLTSYFSDSDDIFNAKLYFQERYSYYTRVLFIIEMHIKNFNINGAWTLLKESAFQNNTCKGQNNEKEISHRNDLIDALLQCVVEKEVWRIGLDVVKYIIQNKISGVDVKKYASEIFRQAINQKCNLSDIKEFIDCSEYWYSYIDCNIIRAFVAEAVVCTDWELAKKVYTMGWNIDMYPTLIGNERILNIPLNYVLEEIWLIFEIFFDNMIQIYPVQHNIIIRVVNDVKMNSVEPLPKNLQQFNVCAVTMQARLANILSNCIKPPIALTTQHKSLVLTVENVNKHLEARILKKSQNQLNVR